MRELKKSTRYTFSSELVSRSLYSRRLWSPSLPVRSFGTNLDMTSSRKPAPKLQGLTGTYSPSPDGIDTSLLLLLHGLGDSAAPFANLARSLSLPQTATLALNAPLRVPFLEENNLQWWPSFDMATGDRTFPLSHPQKPKELICMNSSKPYPILTRRTP